MRVPLTIILLSFIAMGGCGSSGPDAAAVMQRMTPEQLAVGEPIVNSVGMVLVPIPAGEFQMGSAVNDAPLEQRYKQLLQDPEVKRKLDDGQVTKAELVEYLERDIRRQQKLKSGPESPQHLVKISKPFFISSCEVTQQQYEQVLGTSPWQGKPLVEEDANCVRRM